ncbi:hypothetical protein BS47DRAFT_1336437 [Hydnum rufescens UP504]|uniref:Uncharacterized protein n=1 Tax=Hydnum rufescens UP504 TaxID=1448309 RepID=A0A9P6E020_9AGAM|nr:hypothetical protein BS47DRAFT_1336437 [Hydnum rufescens UP504]
MLAEEGSRGSGGNHKATPEYSTDRGLSRQIVVPKHFRELVRQLADPSGDPNGEL